MTRTIQLDLDHAHKLDQLVKHTGGTAVEIVHAAIDAYQVTALPESKNSDAELTLLEKMQAAGLIGVVKNGPPDLSTNPIYMEGFGRD